ncbi:MAG: glycosyltransferase [Ignavibacteriaceae bacterium]|nr:glycosyltransferase [Ignavibacteriaceae bacterium]
MILLIVTYFILVIVAAVSVYNYLTAPVLLSNNSVIEDAPKVSVLIPARNEESNIRRCLEKVLKQDYPNFEVIILDDQSTDNTYKIAEDLQRTDQRIKILQGENLPKEWLGKNWACYQLASRASGKILLFIDADVELEKSAVTSAVVEIKNNSLQLLSVFPTQIKRTFGEQLIVPLMKWFLLSFLPLVKVFKSANPAFTAANGQFMIWDSNAYFKLGGHKSFKDKVVEDMEMARAAKLNYMKIKTFLGGNIVKCRMYDGFISSFNGFSKNFFPGSGMPWFVFLILLILVTSSLTLPVILWNFQTLYLPAVFLIFINRILIAVLSKQNIVINVLLHPVQMILLLAIGFSSVIKTKLRVVKWKGRKL